MENKPTAMDTDSTMDTDLEEEPPHLSPRPLPDEHLQLIFDIRKNLDDEMHIQ
jgi:hypothetical protein